MDESATTIQDVGGFEGGFIDPPIEDLEKDEILAAVQGLSDLVDSLETSSDLAEDIAVIGQSLDDLIDISDVIDQEVISVIDTYFTVNAGDFGGVPLANTDDLVAALQASLDASLGAGSSVSGGATGGGDLGFVVQFETSVSQFLPFVSLDLDELGGLAGAGAQALSAGRQT